MDPRTSRSLTPNWTTPVLLVLFVLLGCASFWRAQGDDLASSYVGCRVLASPESSSLYSYDPVNFAGISEADTVWPALAASGGYGGWLHPYVQTPLWAWLLQPLCLHLQWPFFKHIFLFLALASVAGSIYLVGRFWTPRLLHPAALFLLLGAVSLSEPYVFAMQLVQTHALLLLLTIAGLILAERNSPFAAGLSLACATAVKVTPAVVLVYWLAHRRWRAVLSLLVWSAFLLGFTRVVVGATVFHQFSANMHRLSGVLLVAENNQSLAAWYMGRFFAPDEVFDVNTFPLPTILRFASTALMLGFATLGGYLDYRRTSNSPEQNRAESVPPFGAGLTLIAMTVFAPIAWTHYFLVLVLPIMMLLQILPKSPHTSLRYAIAIAVIAIAAPLFRPLAPDVVHMDLSDAALLRGTFYAAGISLLALLGVGWQQRLSKQSVPGSSKPS